MIFHTIIFLLFFVLLCAFIVYCFTLPKGKDKNLLILYIFIILIGAFSLPFSFAVMFLSMTSILSEEHITASILLFFFLILYLMPSVVTIFAMVKKWSRYLDLFFNRLLFPTILFLFALETRLDLSIVIPNDFLETIDALFQICAPIYYPIYLIIVLNNIMKRIKIKFDRKNLIIIFKRKITKL